MKYIEYVNLLIKSKVLEEDNLVIFGQNVSAGSCLSGLTKNLKVKENSLIINTPNCENTLCGVGFGLMLNKISSIFFMKQQDFLLLGIDHLVNTYNFIRRENPSASFTIFFIVVDQGYQGLQSSLNNFGDFCSIARVPGFTITNKFDAEEIINKHLISSGFRIIGVSQRLFNKEILDFLLFTSDKSYPNDETNNHYNISNEDKTIFQYSDGEEATILCFNFSFSYGLKLFQQLNQKNFNSSLFSVNAVTPVNWSKIIENVKRTKKIVVIDDSKSINLSCDNFINRVLNEKELREKIKKKIIIKRNFLENWLWPNSEELKIDYGDVVEELTKNGSINLELKKDKVNPSPILVNVSRENNQIQLPIWAGVLINSLKLHQIEPRVIDLIPLPAEERGTFFKSKLPSEPTIFGFNIIAGNHHLDEVERYAKLVLEANSKNIIVYGGPLPSAIPELMLKNCSCDYVIAGEGEFSFPQLIKALQEGNRYPIGIKGLFYKKENHIVGERRTRILELGLYSTPNYDLFDMDYYVNYLKETGQSFEIMATRGCRGNCSFCYKFCGYGLSFRDVDLLLDEVETVIQKYKMRKIYFVDENFFDSRDFFFNFIRRKKERKMDFTFIGQARLDCIDEEILTIGKGNGLICISTGIESHSQETLNKINKGIKIADIEEKIKLVRKHDILLLVSLIVGFEWDTEESFQELEQFIIRNKLEKKAKIHYLTPLPETRLFKEAVEKGYIKEEFEYIRNLGDLYWERMVNMTSLSDEVLDYYYQKLYKLCSKEVSYPKSERYLRHIRKIH